jgi:hypothetical protein
MLATQAVAEPAAVTISEELSASPDAPAFGYIYRKAPRVVLSAIIPVAGRSSDATIGFRITPFVEIYDESHPIGIIPNQDWRGRVSLEGWRLWQGSKPEQGRWLRIGLGFEHESDHSSLRRDAPPVDSSIRELNDVAFRVGIGTTIAPFVITGRVDSRLILQSCTRPGVNCYEYSGASSYGGALDLTFQVPIQEAKGWAGFWSISYSWVMRNDDVIGENRLVSHLGLWTQTLVGSWQFFVLGYLGNEVGIDRDISLQQVGVGVRWAP